MRRIVGRALLIFGRFIQRLATRIGRRDQESRPDRGVEPDLESRIFEGHIAVDPRTGLPAPGRRYAPPGWTERVRASAPGLLQPPEPQTQNPEASQLPPAFYGPPAYETTASQSPSRPPSGTDVSGSSVPTTGEKRSLGDQPSADPRGAKDAPSRGAHEPLQSQSGGVQSGGFEHPPVPQAREPATVASVPEDRSPGLPAARPGSETSNDEDDQLRAAWPTTTEAESASPTSTAGKRRSPEWIRMPSILRRRKSTELSRDFSPAGGKFVEPPEGESFQQPGSRAGSHERERAGSRTYPHLTIADQTGRRVSPSYEIRGERLVPAEDQAADADQPWPALPADFLDEPAAALIDTQESWQRLVRLRREHEGTPWSV